jgi:hypothetical protein
MSREAADTAPDVLVIRVWNEQDARPSFRARVIYGGDDEPGAVCNSTADPDAVLDAVRTWLTARIGRTGPG